MYYGKLLQSSGANPRIQPRPQGRRNASKRVGGVDFVLVSA